MWRLDNCFIHGCVFYYWMCRSDVPVIPFRMCLFSFFFLNHSFWPCRYGIFDLFLTVGDKFFWSDNSGAVSWLLGLDRIFK